MKVVSPQFKTLLTSFLFFALLFLLVVYPADNRKSDIERLINRAKRDVIPQSTPDSLLRMYLKINDSVNRIIQWKEHRIKSAGTSTFVQFMGINRIDECDSCNGISEGQSDYRRKHFISFTGFALRDNATFLIDQNNYIIENFVPEKKTENGSIGHMESKKVRVRLSTENVPTKGLTLLIPVSQKAFIWIEIFMYALMAVAFIVGIWIFIKLPVEILLNIANGKSFNKKNIKNLAIIGWTIIGFAFCSILIPKLIQVLFPSLIPKEIYYPMWLVLFDYKWSFIGGAAILLLAKAFKKGYNLQQEQDLTV